MGGGIAMNFANVGLRSLWSRPARPALDKGLAVVRKNYESTLKKGRLTAQDSSAAGADQDAVVRGRRKRRSHHRGRVRGPRSEAAVFESLDAKAKPSAILASNTSTLDLDRLPAFTRRPQDVVGDSFLQFRPTSRGFSRSCAVQSHRQGRVGHRSRARQTDQEDRHGLGRVRRFHRQSHAARLFL